MRFVDTNVLLYAVSTVADEAHKAQLARGVLQQHDLALSVQVLQEFYVQATRPNKVSRISHEQAASLIEAWCRFPVLETTVRLVRAALATRSRYQISYWDAAVVEAARASGCPVLLSEDLKHGEDFEGVTVHNPFLA